MRRSHTQTPDPAGYYPPPPDPADVQCWHACGREKCAFLHDIDFLGKRPAQQKAGKQGKSDKTLNNELES